MPDIFGNPTPEDMAQQAREAAAGRLRRGAMGQQSTQPQIPYGYQTWGNLAETTAQQFPNFQGWTPGQGPPPQSELEKTLGMAGIFLPAFRRDPLMRAQSMQAEGATPSEMWAATQTAQYPLTGRWLQEIPGVGGVMNPSLAEAIRNRQPVSPTAMREVFDYPELYAEHGQYGDIGFQYLPQQKFSGRHFPPQQTLPRGMIQLGGDITNNDPRSVIHHELQHRASRGLDLVGKPAASFQSEAFTEGTPAYQHYLNIKQQYPHIPDNVARSMGGSLAYRDWPDEQMSRLSQFRRDFDPSRIAREPPFTSLLRMLRGESRETNRDIESIAKSFRTMQGD